MRDQKLSSFVAIIGAMGLAESFASRFFIKLCGGVFSISSNL
jgi:hypothetical protein